MDRLQTELSRLYRLPGQLPGRVRALLLEVQSPGGWRELSAVWKGVQADLELPAPAIAVSGSNGLQLWFSLAEPIDEAEAMAFLDALRLRYLGDTPAARVRMAPVHASSQGDSPDAVPLPPHQVASERWSVFVAHDLASLFDDERWLDQPADADAQADLLGRIDVTQPDAFARAMALLGQPGGPPQDAEMAARPRPTTHRDPREFLLSVMNDPSVPMVLRIDAAKALLAQG
jgi:hypothetical protein